MEKYLESVQKQFLYYKQLGEGAISQLTQEQLLSNQYGTESSIQLNSIAIIVKHLVGNMKSRWTNIYEEDGEKSCRDRDGEFQQSYTTKSQILQEWSDGWAVLFAVINNATKEDLEKEVFIRNMGHSLTEAINRQMMHYAYHIGQIVQIAKMWKGDQWKSLSIPLNQSKVYNAEKFSKAKSTAHFTDEFLSDDTKS